MLNYLKISKLIEDNVSVREHFYSKIGVTRIGWNATMKNKSMKVETLERVAAYFKKPISYFFDEEIIILGDSIDEDGKDYKALYYEANELYVDTLKKYTLCLEENKSLTEHKPGATKPASKDVHKSKLK